MSLTSQDLALGESGQAGDQITEEMLEAGCEAYLDHASEAWDGGITAIRQLVRSVLESALPFRP